MVANGPILSGTEQLVKSLSSRLGEQLYDIWFRGVDFRITNDSIEIWFADELAVDRLMRHKADIANTIHEVFDGRQAVYLVVSSDHSSTGREKRALLFKRRVKIRAEVKVDESKDGSEPARPKPNLEYSLDSFVVGASNAAAYRAAVDVVENTGAGHNPLFILAPADHGKTHLLQGLCGRFVERFPDLRVKYLKAESFVENHLEAVRHGGLDRFRRAARDTDLLVLDGIHVFAGRLEAQKELLDTLNAVMAKEGARVIVSSRLFPPSEGWLIESIRTRVLDGTIVRIDPPNFEMRRDFLKSLRDKVGSILNDEVVDWIARRVTGGLGEVHGAFNRIVAEGRVLAQAPDVAMARQVFVEFDGRIQQRPGVELVLRVVADFFGQKPEVLITSSRRRKVSLARAIAWHLIRKMCDLSFPEIGQETGHKNHSSVISACNRIRLAVDANTVLSWKDVVGLREIPTRDIVEMLEGQIRAAQKRG